MRPADGRDKEEMGRRFTGEKAARESIKVDVLPGEIEAGDVL
jgi:hypothetical protein